MFADYHVHTEFSDDSEYPMEQVIKDSISMGMDELCFTDHVDYGVKVDWDDTNGYEEAEMTMNVDYPLYAARIKELQYLYDTRLKIKMGLEFGMQTHTIPAFQRLFAKYPFDFIILSVHQIENREFWNQEFQRGKSQKEYNERYYKELLHLVNHYQQYSVLGHLDSIVRYDLCGVYPYKETEPVIREILKRVIYDGKGIELNTSWHRYGLGDTTPSVDILKCYRELGGEIVTLGSDSHRPEHLGAYMKEAKDLLRHLGFRYHCTYNRMQPVFHSL